MMWDNNLHLWSALAWTFLAFVHQPVAGLLQYKAAKLLRLRCYLHDTLPMAAIHLHLDIALLPHLYTLQYTLELKAKGWQLE